ncbi:iron chelate uptake ABC transporter family permease subunit [Streptomyces sp. R11]|uniref:Iron chelate uptake ABC transporter family permease subunit n=1 Tax=Streptomyces sp. R11 TaxID=3238625 RepID=A0AB39N9M0_9ACTN
MTATQQGAPIGAPFRALRHVPLFLTGFAALALCTALSLTLGARSVPLGTVADALLGNVHGREALVVTGLRLPRTVMGLAVGAALGAAGAVAQGITRNPLASPTTLGINAGAGFAVVVAVFALKLNSPAQYVWFAFAGAAGATLFAQTLARRAGGMDPVRPALGGTVLRLVLPATVVRFIAGPTRLYQSNSYSGVVLNDIGFQRPKSQVSDDPEVTMKDVSPEGMDQADADLVFVTAADAEDKTQKKQVVSDPVWKDLPAAKDGKVFEVPDETLDVRHRRPGRRGDAPGRGEGHRRKAPGEVTAADLQGRAETDRRPTCPSPRHPLAEVVHPACVCTCSLSTPPTP